MSKNFIGILFGSPTYSGVIVTILGIMFIASKKIIRPPLSAVYLG